MIELILLQSKSKFAVPYDSTQGVPGWVFLFAWVLIALFLIRLAWEYRDKLFPKKFPSPEDQIKRRKSGKK